MNNPDETTAFCVRKFLALIQAYFHKHYTIKEYAEMIGVTDNHLIKMCRRELGKTPLSILHHEMINEAIKLLNEDISIKEAAVRLGFRDLANFNHFFKSMTNTTPKQYRLILDK